VPSAASAKLVAINILQARAVEAVKVIECPLFRMAWQRMLRPSDAPEWRLVGQENYAASVSGIVVPP